MRLGYIGLGKMGSRMVEKLIREEHEVVVWNRSEEPIINLKEKINNNMTQFSVAVTIEDVIAKLTPPRIIWMMLPAGEVTENIYTSLESYCY